MTYYCKNRNVLLSSDDLKRIDKKYIKSASIDSPKKKIIYKTLKKKNGYCIFYKNGKCKLRKKPLLCETHPLYFRINFSDETISWFLYERKGRKFIQTAKKKLITFLKKEDPKILAIYLLKTRRMKLKLLEEEAIPEELVKKLEEIKKFL